MALELTIGLALVCACGAAAAADTVVLDGQRPFMVPDGWTLAADTGSAAEAPGASIAVTVALQLSAHGVEQLHRDLGKSSDPTNPIYDPVNTPRWGYDALVSTLAPPKERVAAVVEWLTAPAGCGAVIEAVSPNRGFVSAAVPLAGAERCFGVSFERFTHAATGARAVASRAPYRVPTSLAHHIEFVGGLTKLPRLRPRLHPPSPPAGVGLGKAAYNITPAVISALYGLPDTVPKSSNVQAIAAFSNESFTPADLAAFQARMGLPNQPAATKGPACLPKGGTGEGSLDPEYLMGVCPTVPTVVWATAGQTYDGDDHKYDNEPFLKWVVNVSSTPPPIPNIFSLSYQDFEDGVDQAYMLRLNTEFAALAMRGTTLVTGSGDWGVGCAPATAVFQSDFPSSSPYVVSTGATTFPPGQPAVAGTEVGIGFSSGGFSNTFAQPSYQKAAVAAFLAQSSVSRKLFNASGRAFPDVSAVGDEFQIIINGVWSPVGGTSASSPTFAAVLSRINSARLASGRQTLGWVNPALYAAASASVSASGSRADADAAPAYHDVTMGSNAHGRCVGFNATKGWDPMTGSGTPNFPVLSKLLGA